VTIQLDTQARVIVDNSAAVGPLKSTQAATRDLAQEMGRAGAAGTTSGKQIAAAAREAERAQSAAAKAVAAARREEERATQAAIRAIQAYGAEARVANQAAAAAARQALTSYQQLGFQISDVAAQAAVGTNPMVIFAQQGGQIAQALAGAGGVLGRVAGFLAGPWGAAVLGAGAILGVLASNSEDAGDSAEDMADRFGDAAADVQLATDSMDRAISGLSGLLNDAGNWFADFALDVAGAMAKAYNEIDDFIVRSEGLIPRVLGGGPALLPSRLEQQRAAAGRAIAGGRADRALAGTGGNQLFGFDPYRSGEFSPFDSKSLETFAQGAERAREAGEREAKQLADTASREAKRASDAATREAQRFAAEQAKLVEGLADLARKTSAEIDKFARGDGSLVGLIERIDAAAAAREAASQRSRDATGLSAAVASAERNIDKRKVEGKAAAEAFNRSVLQAAQTIGDAIGNAAGRSVTEVVEAALSGQIGSIRGPAGNAIRGLQPLARELGRDQGIREGLRPLVNQLKQVFGDQPLGQQLGKSLEAAGFGVAIADIVGKGSREERIGGAIGAAGGQALGTAIGGPLGGEIGKVAGSIIGTAIGGLFVKVKSGSVAISGANGEIITGAAIGSGGAQRRNAEALGSGISGALQSVVDRLGGTIGNFAVSIGQNGGKFRVDPTGQGRTRKSQSGVLAFDTDADAAFAAALEDAIRDGAVSGVSPRVQSALQRYASDIDKAVAEALKVRDLENFLSDRSNPFGSVFRDFERQASERLKVARQYGFDVLEIEKVNAEERAKLLKEQLGETTASAKALLDDIRFGSRAEGSVRDRLSALGSERSRLEGLVAGGDTGQIDALAQIIQQQLDLSREAFGSTGQFAADRGGAINSLETLIRQTEDRINAAAAAAQNPTVDKLTELNTSADETVTELQRQTAILQQLAQGGGLAAFSIGAFARSAV
jgi:hypothetical protein